MNFTIFTLQKDEIYHLYKCVNINFTQDRKINFPQYILRKVHLYLSRKLRKDDIFQTYIGKNPFQFCCSSFFTDDKIVKSNLLRSKVIVYLKLEIMRMREFEKEDNNISFFQMIFCLITQISPK